MAFRRPRIRLILNLFPVLKVPIILKQNQLPAYARIVVKCKFNRLDDARLIDRLGCVNYFIQIAPRLFPIVIEDTYKAEHQIQNKKQIKPPVEPCKNTYHCWFIQLLDMV